MHKSTNDRHPSVTDSLTLIHFPPGGKDAAQTVLDSCYLLSNFLILPTHLTPHILRPLTAWINYTSETLSGSSALSSIAVLERGKKKKADVDSKWRIRGCTLVRVPSAVCVGLWQLEPPRRKTTTSCLSSRRIPPAHATCFHGNRKKFLALVTVTYLGQNGIPLETKPRQRSDSNSCRRSHNETCFGELRRHRSRARTVETNIDGSQGLEAFNLPTSTFFVGKSLSERTN